MKSRVAHFATGLLMWVGLVSSNYAVTLGDLRGSVVIGHPIDVSVIVQAAAGEDVSAACFKAEVFHADALQASPTLTVRPLSNTADGSYRVRVQSAAPVDEPVVTVALQSTCLGVLTRRYVVLADFPVVVMPEPQAPNLPQVPPPVVTPEPARPGSSTAAAPIAAPTVISPPPPATVATAAAQKPAAPKRKLVPKKAPPRNVVKPAVAISPQASAPTPAPPVESSKPALKLEALNLPASLTDGLATAPLSLPSPEAALQASQILALQEELKQLRLQTAKTNTQLAELQVQLQRAQSERISLQVFYVVLVLLLLCAAVLVWLLWQRYREQSTHETDTGILGQVALTPTHPEKTVAPLVTANSSKTAPLTQAASSPPPRKPGGASDSMFESSRVVSPTLPASLMDSVADHDDQNAFSNTRLQDASDSSYGLVTHEEVDLDLDLSNWGSLGESAKPHLATSEPVLDIRQQAEFFVSLGQTERALVVLKKQIADSDQPDPSIYLDLLSLYHSLGYKTDFREYRTTFNQHFNCVLPDFPAYHLEGLDLMSYPNELAQLTQLWRQPEAITFLHSCIHRTERSSAQPSFELAAFRDLLLLLDIAEQEIDPQDA